MGAMASQNTSITIVYSTVYSGTDQRKHQSSASLAFVLGIHRWPVNSPHKWPVTRKMFPFDDVIMETNFIFSPRLQVIYRSSFSDETTLQRPDVGVTNAPLVDFSIRDITFWSCENTCWIIRVTFVSYGCHSSRAVATPVKIWTW